MLIYSIRIYIPLVQYNSNSIKLYHIFINFGKIIHNNIKFFEKLCYFIKTRKILLLGSVISCILFSNIANATELSFDESNISIEILNTKIIQQAKKHNYQISLYY